MGDGGGGNSRATGVFRRLGSVTRRAGPVIEAAAGVSQAGDRSDGSFKEISAFCEDVSSTCR